MIEVLSLGSFLLNAVQFIRGERNRTQNKKFDEQRQRVQEELQRVQTRQLAVLSQEHIDFQGQRFDKEKELQKQLAVFNRESLFLVASVLDQHFVEERELQRQLASSNYQAILSAFSKLSVHFEKQRELQQELAEYNRQSLLLVTKEQRESLLAVAETNKIFENWPLLLSPSQILGRHRDNKKIPLKVLLAPPTINFDRYARSKSSASLISESRLETGLQRFLEAYYPLESSIRPVELIDGVWDSKRYHGTASIIALHSKLKSEPILILEMIGDQDNISLRVGYWGYGQETYWYRTVVPDLSLSALFNTDPNAANDVLVNLLCFITSWFTDVHHLTYAEHPENVPPLLPKILSTLIGGDLAGPILQPLMPQFVSNYQTIFDALKQEQPYLVPKLALQLAESLSQLPDKTYARKYLNYSMEVRLESRGVTQMKGQQLFNLILATLDVHSLDYVELLQRCLTNLGEDESVKKLSMITSSLFDPLFSGKTRDRYGDTLYGLY